MSEIYVRRIPLDEVPADDEGASNYLHDLYRSKVSFLAEGCTHVSILIMPLQLTLYLKYFGLNGHSLAAG